MSLSRSRTFSDTLPPTTKVIYVDATEELQEAVEKLGFLFEEPEE